MRASASAIKLDAIRLLGAEVIKLGDTPLAVELDAGRQEKLKRMAFVSPYNDIDVIAGQGTIGMELHEQATGLVDDFAAAFASVKWAA